tara:strand:+ start:240 stop:620 length:381 start_codon:yes stop_codon:yes gene_type:complete
MAINNEVDIHLAIEELGLNKPTNSYVLNVGTHSIEKWYDRNEDTKPTDDQINAAWETWKSKNGSLALVELRYERNLKLKKTDWMASPDRTMTDAQKTYRQTLRDLPANQTPTDVRLSNITWPTEPS